MVLTQLDVNDAEETVRHHMCGLWDGSQDRLMLYDDNEVPCASFANKEVPVVLLFLQRVSPIINLGANLAVYRSLSVWGHDRVALMAAPFGPGPEGFVGKPYEAKSHTPLLSCGKSFDLYDVPETVYVLHVARTSTTSVYEGEQQNTARKLLSSSPVIAWRMAAQSLGTNDAFCKHMKSSVPNGQGVALVTFCGAVLKEVAERRLPRDMLLEQEEKYQCFWLIRQSILIAPGLLTEEDTARHFPVAQNGVGVRATTWPEELKSVMERTLSEGLVLQPGQSMKQVRRFPEPLQFPEPRQVPEPCAFPEPRACTAT